MVPRTRSEMYPIICHRHCLQVFFLLATSAVLLVGSARVAKEDSRKSSQNITSSPTALPPPNMTLTVTPTSTPTGRLVLLYANESDFDHQRPINATQHAGFLHGFVESLSVILVSEVGDKTYFIAAILAMTNNRLTVFLAAISALALMTVLSALLGWVVTAFIPRVYTYYACTAIMFLFGLKMLWEAYTMKPDEVEELQQEVQQELERRGSLGGSVLSLSEQPADKDGREGHKVVNPPDQEQRAVKQEGASDAPGREDLGLGRQTEFTFPQHQLETAAGSGSRNEEVWTAAAAQQTLISTSAASESPAAPSPTPRPVPAAAQQSLIVDPAAAASPAALSPTPCPAEAAAQQTLIVPPASCPAAPPKKRVRIREKSLFGKQCYKHFKLFVNCFTMTFLAEWGDRSQLATIVLASINDVAGVCLGGILGHTACTATAVLAGALVAKRISVRAVTLIGALVFLGFAVASLFVDPEQEEMLKIDMS